jgi:hypothetical protein
MKKLLLFSVVAMAGITTNAVDITKEEYIAKHKAAAEKDGKRFVESKIAALFDRADLNKDGVLTDEEKSTPRKKSTE